MVMIHNPESTMLSLTDTVALFLKKRLTKNQFDVHRFVLTWGIAPNGRPWGRILS